MGTKYVFNPTTGNLDATDVVAFNGEVEAGTAAAPSIFFTGDPNTGIYSPGADQLAISTSGQGRLFVDANGNVGINVAAGGATGFGNGFIKSKAITGVPGLFLENSNGTSWWGVYGGSSLADSTAIVYPDGGSLRIATTTGPSVAGFSEKLRITSDGKLGLGTSSPTQALTIADTTAAQIHLHSVAPAIRLSSDTTGGNAANRAFFGLSTAANGFINGSALNDLCIVGTSGGKVLFGQGNTAAMVITSAGRVGIGTNAPAHKFVVEDTSVKPVIALIGPSNDAVNLYFGDSENNGIGRITYNNANDSLAFTANAIERARIDNIGTFRVKGSGVAGISDAVQLNGSAPPNSLLLDASGRLGLGTSGPGYKLHVDGGNGVGATQAYFGSASGFWRIVNAGPTTTRANLGAFNSSGVETIRFDPAGASWITGGALGISTTTASEKLQIEDPTAAKIKINKQFYSGLQIGQNSDQTSEINQVTTADLLFKIANTEAFRVDTSRRLLVGTASDSGGALLQVNGNRIRIATAKTPASATDTGTAGEICWDADYVYVCTATNTWKRTAIATW